MEKVYLLLITWNRKGDNGYELKVYSSMDKAQIMLSKEVYSDIGEFTGIDGIDNQFDFTEAAEINLPCPTTYITLYNGELYNACEDYVEYQIFEYPVL